MSMKVSDSENLICDHSDHCDLRDHNSESKKLREGNRVVILECGQERDIYCEVCYESLDLDEKIQDIKQDNNSSEIVIFKGVLKRDDNGGSSSLVLEQVEQEILYES